MATQVAELERLEAKARFQRSEVRRYRAGLRVTMTNIADITRRLEAIGITNGAADREEPRHGHEANP